MSKITVSKYRTLIYVDGPQLIQIPDFEGGHGFGVAIPTTETEFLVVKQKNEYSPDVNSLRDIILEASSDNGWYVAKLNNDNNLDIFIQEGHIPEEYLPD